MTRRYTPAGRMLIVGYIATIAAIALASCVFSGAWQQD